MPKKIDFDANDIRCPNCDQALTPKMEISSIRYEAMKGTNHIYRCTHCGATTGVFLADTPNPEDPYVVVDITVNTVVRPQGVHRKRLIQQLGRESWVYKGEPRKMVAIDNGQEIEAWVFDWNGIPRDVQEVMTINYARSHGGSLPDAWMKLSKSAQAIPCDHVKLDKRRKGYRSS
ncbi:MAG: hypothetical protein SF029_26005 [bacterium]|nr:hypothetical protein [bacterium]